MIGKELIELFNKGLRPLVKFTKEVEDLDLQFEEGMLAKIVDIKKSNCGDLYDIVFDEKEFNKYNIDLEKPCCANKYTFTYDSKWSEIKKRYDRVTISIDVDDEVCNFEIIDDAYAELVREFLDSETDLTYVEWLQEKLLELRALM